MYCEKCGEFIPNNDSICINCGTKVNSNTAMIPSNDKCQAVSGTTYRSNATQPQTNNVMYWDDIQVPESPARNIGKRLSCPSCGSFELQPMIINNTNVSSKGGGYSAGQGCCGLLLLGPLGLLCGACGSKQKISTTNTSKIMWVCKYCGQTFCDMDEELLEKEEQNIKKHSILMYILLILLFAIIGMIITTLLTVSTAKIEMYY